MIAHQNCRVLFGLIAILVIFCLQQTAKANNLHTAYWVQPDRILKGQVVSEKGEPLAGVTVQLKGSAKGTVTDVSGNYSLSIPDNGAVIVFNFIGFEKQEVPVTTAATLNITLLEESKQLSQVVVIGYGTTRKRDLTGAVSSVKMADVKGTAVTSFDQALQGRAAGVQVTQVSGKPGGQTSIRIRGTSSITAGNEPLYVIDGMLVTDNGFGLDKAPTSGLSLVNPSDIESIEILKDASASAIYGSRGANGVVLITTKHGKSGQGSISFDAYYGFQDISKKLDVLNAAQYANLVNEANINSNKTPEYVNPKNLGKGTDWQNALYRTAPISNYQLSFSGGSDKTQYAISGGYFNQDGIIINSGFKRYSFRTNIESKVNSWMSAGANLNVSRVQTKGVVTNQGYAVTSAAFMFNPALPIYDPTQVLGYTFENDKRQLINPIADALESDYVSVNNRILGNTFVKFELAKELELKTSFGIDASYINDNSFAPNYLKRTLASKGELAVVNAQALDWLSETTLSYGKVINSKHDIKALVGYTMEKYVNESTTNLAFDFPDDRLRYHDIGAALNPQRPSSAELSYSLVSWLGRVNYTFDKKYLLTLTGRVDGSSKFAEGNKFGFFPSAALAWRVSDEAFLQSVKSINDLKLRVSYGVIGNQSIAPYQSLSLINRYGEGVFNRNEPYFGREPASYSNKDLKWESTAQFDLGVDLTAFDNRVNFTADVYDKKTYDLLLYNPIPYTSGFNQTLLNVGNIQNRGFELSVNTTNTTGELKWNTAVNFSRNVNKVTKLNSNNDNINLGYSLIQVGQPIGAFYGLIFEGIFQTDEEAANSPVLRGQEANSSYVSSRAKAGDRKYRDINKDGVIDANDRTFIGSAQPDFIFGINNSLSYKNFDLSFFFQGSVGNKLANYNLFDLERMTGENNVLYDAYANRWTPENPSNKYPRAQAEGSLDLGTFSSRIVEDASYIRLKNVTLGYNFPTNWLTRAKLKRLRLYASATNLFTFTGYKGYDPEANFNGQSTTAIGLDQAGYPMSKSITFGINIGL
jgi:TonB-linked SusC/RagA family outer membrane protein